MPIFRVKGEIFCPFEYDDVYAETDEDAEQIAYERAVTDLGFTLDADVQYFEVSFVTDEDSDE